MTRPIVIERLLDTDLRQRHAALEAYDELGQWEDLSPIDDVDSIRKTFEIRRWNLQRQSSEDSERLAFEIEEFLLNLARLKPRALGLIRIRSHPPIGFLVHYVGESRVPISCMRLRPNPSQEKAELDRELGF